jgi:type IV pilus assembly protein PilB
LVDARILTPERLEHVLTLQKADGRRLGTLLVEGGLVTETQLTQILSQQLSVPWVSLYHIDFSRELLALVPREVAEKYCLVPIYVRPVRGQGDTLYVAMDDPQNEDALKECSRSSGLPARAMIASPSDIRKAVRLYYGGTAQTSASSPKAAAASRPPPAPPAARIRSAPPAPPRDSAPPAAPAEPPSQPALREPPTSSPMSEEASSSQRIAAIGPATARAVASATVGSSTLAETPNAKQDDAPELEVREVDLSARGKKRKGQISLTLLDGTTIALPSAKKRPKAETTSEELTTRDLIAALKAVSHGADAKEILGEDVRWEKMFAVLLKVLLKKHLVLDHEFIEELKKS